MKKKLEKLSTFIVPRNYEEKKQTFIKLLLSFIKWEGSCLASGQRPSGPSQFPVVMLPYAMLR